MPRTRSIAKHDGPDGAMNGPAPVLPATNLPGNERAAREQLLTAASAVLRDGDTIDLSLAELAKRAKLNSALVKYYFGNKAGLLLALVERDMADIVGALDGLLAEAISPAEKLSRHVASVVDTFYRHPYLNRLLMRIIREADGPTAKHIAAAWLDPMVRFYDDLVAEGVKSGSFRPMSPQMLYFSVTGMADRFFAARLVLRHCYDGAELTEVMRDGYRNHIIDLIMAGVMAPRP